MCLFMYVYIVEYSKLPWFNMTHNIIKICSSLFNLLLPSEPYMARLVKILILI